MKLHKAIDNLYLKAFAFKTSLKATCRRLRGIKSEYAEAVDNIRDTLRCIMILKSVGEETQKNVVRFIENVVSKALSDVFAEDAYTFKIGLTPTKKSMQVNFFFVKDGEEYEPLDCCGYGTVDVACFALRVSLFAISSTPNTTRTMIFDEPFKNVSAKYRSRIAQFVKTISTEMKIQFIIVTHFTEMKEFGDNIITVTKEGIRCEQHG
jgi:DNA repair exonuclease SbcCD ATPase subunit